MRQLLLGLLHCAKATEGTHIQCLRSCQFVKTVELVGILCGAKTIAQSNVTIRTDPAVQRAFGRQGCAEQSTIARTLRACTAENVVQFQKVSWYYLKRYGATPRHRFHETR